MSNLDFTQWLRSLTPKQVRRAKLAFDQVMGENAPQGQTLPEPSDGSNGQGGGPLAPELIEQICEMLSGRLSEQELAAVKQALVGPKAAAAIPNTPQRERTTASDSAARIRTYTPGQVDYVNGSVANGRIGGFEYRHGVRTNTAPAQSSSAADFAKRFPTAARIRSV